jgi:pimeloyl-ACP methyl ester carboxylesterase
MGQRHFFTSRSRAFLTLFICSEVFAAPARTFSIPSNSSISIHWSNCTSQDPAFLRCGEIQAPIDYANPSGGTFSLQFAQLKADNTSRVGSLVFNPGGPGGSGSETIINIALGKKDLLSPKLVSHYDLIGLDTRGTGRSSPIKCDPSIWNQHVSSFPKNEEDFIKMTNRNKALGESCKNKTGALLGHLDTMNQAKDMELVRQALNGGKLNFLGVSYGTVIGAAYAEQFPEQVGHMVLDGITDHSNSEIATMASATITYEITLNKFFQWCNETSDCALHSKDAAGIFDTIIANATKKPIPAPGCSSPDASCRSNATAEDILIAVKNGLGSVNASEVGSGWHKLAADLAQAAKGNATALSANIFPTESSQFFSALGIICQDWNQTATSLTDFAMKQQMMSALAPHTRGISQTANLQAHCLGWPVPVTNPPHVLNSKVKNAAPILLVNSIWDPATSIDWANNLRSQIPKSVLIVRNGGGHTSYLTFGETMNAMDNFLLNGTLPSQGATYNS